MLKQTYTFHIVDIMSVLAIYVHLFGLVLEVTAMRVNLCHVKFSLV